MTKSLQVNETTKRRGKKYEIFKRKIYLKAKQENQKKPDTIAKVPLTRNLGQKGGTEKLVNASKRSLSESRVRENRTHGLTRGDEVILHDMCLMRHVKGNPETEYGKI